MHLGARIQAAAEILDEIEERRRPAADALRDWGRAHRFAGSGDRAVIGNLVFDALRRRRSLAARLGDDGARLAVLGVAVFAWGRPLAELEELCARRHGPGPLSAAERTALQAPAPETGPPPVLADFPDWLEPSLERVFGSALLEQVSALGDRAPVDLRVNTLKADRAKVLKALARHGAGETPWSPVGIRLPAPQADARYPHVEAEASHGRGWFEVQDEGSQIASLIAGAAPGAQVADLCAGAGGKALALAAAMQNKGQIHAYDSDRTRLRRIFERLKRAGARNVQVLDAGDEARLDGLAAKMDMVFIDAPCTGSGTWRRRPDAKWRLSPQALERRCAEQREVLRLAAPLARPGGRLVYVTCSVLPQENADQVAAFLGTHPDYTLKPWHRFWSPDAGFTSCGPDDGTLLLTPKSHGTDGFFIAVMERAGAL